MSTLFPHFPVFLDLAGRAVILLGEEGALLELAQSCLSAGASVAVFAPKPAESWKAYAPPVRLKARRWKAADFRGATLVVTGVSEERPARARIVAHAVGALFHAIGQPDLSDVALGGIAGEGGLAIGVSAQGAPQALENAVRDRLQASLPPAMSAFLAAAAQMQNEVALVLGAEAQNIFWAALAQDAFEQNFASAEEWRVFIAARLRPL